VAGSGCPLILFRHPLVRSAAYRSASLSERREVHGALAAVTDPATDPDRLAWHRALATEGPDEEVAHALVLSALRTRARGGLAATAMFLEWAARLTPEIETQTSRLLTAATAKRDVGHLNAALTLLSSAELGIASLAHQAEMKRLRGQIAFDRRQLKEAVRLLTEAAKIFEPFDPATARWTLGEALWAAMWTGDLQGTFGIRFAAEAAGSRRRRPRDPIYKGTRRLGAPELSGCQGISRRGYNV
jgi:hypothetical protein